MRSTIERTELMYDLMADLLFDIGNGASIEGECSKMSSSLIL